ncbi:MAG: hypothetical protein A3F09_04180 [Chlamydiae bacterium RIFCSPHIGHO2_12_FULL_49_11]|nr:MAG: hypothetical protein A3F09_04180 [Chlamydiae bacterium RIFCSPHIGHO2_12_FULL_49_11]
MKETLKLIVAPTVSLFVIMLGMSFFNTFISVRVNLDGGSSFVVGLVYSAFYLGMMLGAIYMEKFIRYTGHIRAFSLFASSMAAAIVVQSFFASPWIWLFFRLLTGIASAGLFIVIESWLLLLSSSHTRGVILSLYMVAIYTAQSLGQFFLNVANLEGVVPFLLAIFFCSLSVVPVSLMRASAPSITTSEYINIFYLLKKTPLGFFGNFVAGLILSAFYALGPVYAQEMGFTIFQVSLFMSVTVFGGMALQWPLGLLSDILERRKVIIMITAAISFLGFILFLFPTMPFWLLLITVFIYGGFVFTLYPISITYCCDFFSSSGITAITCAALIIYGIGCIIGPVIAPIVMGFILSTGLFLYSAVVSLLLCIYAIYRHKKLPKEIKEIKEAYQVFPSTTPTITQLDPRKKEEA